MNDALYDFVLSYDEDMLQNEGRINLTIDYGTSLDPYDSTNKIEFIGYELNEMMGTQTIPVDSTTW